LINFVGLEKARMTEQETIQNIKFDVHKVRKDFPILHQEINGKPLVYFDNAATTQKPLVVINAVSDYYKEINANIHRGIHTLAERATAAFEATRDSVKNFINAKYREEVIFTRGTTEGINLVASTYGRQNIKQGDEILISAMEHHSNIVPWHMLAAEKGAIVKIIPINDQGEIILEEFEKLLSPKTKIVALVHVSNALGTINPVKQLIAMAHKQGAVVLIDGAQSSSHLDIDVQEIDADFFALSAHKLYGPTGIGILYGKKELLEAMPPYQGGGEMIGEVSFTNFTVNELPYKFEAGTPNIGDAVAFKYALEYIQKIGKTAIRHHENDLLLHATKAVETLDGIKLIGTAKEKVSILSFVMEGIHHQDLGILLDQKGIAIRTGHHCTQPLMNRFCIPGTSRASFALYNTKEEVDIFIDGMKKAVKMLR
jgi:cysteine desulfurase/selenocysteine lyase